MAVAAVSFSILQRGETQQKEFQIQIENQGTAGIWQGELKCYEADSWTRWITKILFGRCSLETVSE